jgi:DNA-binding transcriptional ArsR family regulator
MSNAAVEDVFDALGQPVRRRIVELLAESPQSVREMAVRLPVGRPAVSRHLRCLSDAGLVWHRRAGTRNLYSLAPAGFVSAQRWLVQAWERVLSASTGSVTEPQGDEGG